MGCCSKPFIPGKLLLVLAMAGLMIGIGRLVMDPAAAEPSTSNPKDETPVDADTPPVLDFEVQTISGESVRLDRYHGKVLLVVNVASKCGLTPQYKMLQKLHEDYAKQGLAILGFPANNFGKQEPGTNEDIAAFCEQNYGVEFDMFAKVSVAGDDQAPLYRFLTSEKTNPKFAGKISWNFEKFLVSRDGQVIARFSPRTKPDDKQVIQAIEEALAKPIPEAVKSQSSDKPAE